MIGKMLTVYVGFTYFGIKAFGDASTSNGIACVSVYVVALVVVGIEILMFN